MSTQEIQEYMRERRERQKDIASHFKYRFIPGDYAKGQAQWAMSQAFYMFIEAVYEKALQAREKYGFYELGWATPDWQEELQRGIAEHLQKGDPRDVAVYAMFAWFHGWSTALPIRGFNDELELIMNALPTEVCGDLNSGETFFTTEGVADAMRTLLQTNARLVDETYRWSEAVKKLEAERAAPASLLLGEEAAPDELANTELVELWAAYNEAVKAFGDYELHTSSVYYLDKSDEADMELAHLTRNALPGLLARLQKAESASPLLVQEPAASGWVSVYERLPEEGPDPTYVLGWWPDGDMRRCQIYNGELSCGFPARGDYPTHWMPEPGAATPLRQDGECLACHYPRYVLAGQQWGSCSNDECANYKVDMASASYLNSPADAAR